MQIVELELGMRAQNVLEAAGIETAEELSDWQFWSRLAAQKNCGSKTMMEIAAALYRVASGDLLASVLEWEIAFPPHAQRELERKAEKYDEIEAIVTGTIAVPR